MNAVGNPSEYIEYLPEIFRRQSVSGTQPFLAQYLKIFEALLSGRADSDAESLDKEILEFPNRIDAGQTPIDRRSADIMDSEFLTYLAGWVALSLDQNWKLDKKRRWLRRIVSLYKKRGTLAGLTEYLHMFIGDQVFVEEPSGGFIVGEQENSTIGVNTFIAGAPAYYFQVKINYGYAPEAFRIDLWRNLRKGIQAIVDLEKPAHTYYSLHARTPGIIVGGPNHPRELARSTVGVDTLIWQESKKISKKKD